MSKVQTRFHSGMFLDETATLSHWHVPAAHFLEAWSDARTVDGTVTIVQPLIQPMFNAKSAHEVVQTLLDRPERNGYDIVRKYWMGQARAGARCAGAARAAGAQGAAWCAGATPTVAPQIAPGQQAGATPRHAASPADVAAVSQQAAPRRRRPNSARPPRSSGTGGDGCMTGSFRAPRLRQARHAAAPGAPSAPGAPGAPSPVAGIEVNFRRDPTIYDGRFANNGWLQELPKPVTKLTWDNAALMAPATAERLECRQRRRHSGHARGSPAARAGVHHAGPCPGCRHRPSRLRPHPRRAGRQRHGLQRLRAARQHSPVVRRRGSVAAPATTTAW